MTDRAKFEREALGHMDAAYNYALHLLAARADAEDAVQDAFIRAFRAFDQLQGVDCKPWLLTIVRNVCYRRLQQRRRGGNVISLDEALSAGTASGQVREGDLAAPERSPEGHAIARSDTAAVTRALAALPPAFREVVVLREFEEMSYREIADVIGAPVGTVMSRLSRAREQLRIELLKVLRQDENDVM